MDPCLPMQRRFHHYSLEFNHPMSASLTEISTEEGRSRLRKPLRFKVLDRAAAPARDGQARTGSLSSARTWHGWHGLSVNALLRSNKSWTIKKYSVEKLEYQHGIPSEKTTQSLNGGEEGG